MMAVYPLAATGATEKKRRDKTYKLTETDFPLWLQMKLCKLDTHG